MTATERRSWLGAGTDPPEIGATPELVADVMADELREVPRAGYPLAMSPIVVPRESYHELLSAASGLLALLRRVALEVAPDRAGRLAALCVDPDTCPLFSDDEAFELRHFADMARPDVIIGPNGPKFIEFNVSGCFGGMAHALVHQRAWRRVRDAVGRPAFVSVDPYARYAELLANTCAELGVPPSAVLVGTARDWGPGTSNRVFDIQVDALRQYGVHATHLDFDDLLAGLGIPGTPSPAVGVAAFSQQDAENTGYDIEPARIAMAAGLRLIPTESSRFLHSKVTLALLSEGRPWMSARDVEMVRRYVPWSRVVGDRPVEWRGAMTDLPGLLIGSQDRFLLKGANGCAGEEVFPGWATSESAWAELVTKAVRDGGFIAQERVEHVPYPLDMLTESGAVERVRAEAVVSPFCLGGAPAGCYVRFTTLGGGADRIGGPGASRTCLVAEA